MGIGEGLITGLLGGVAGGAGQILQRNQQMDKEDETARLEELRARIAEDRAKALMDYKVNKEHEEETRKGGLVKDAYSSSMVDGKVDPRKMRENAIMSGNLQGADVASGLIKEEESGMLHKADIDQKTAYANRLNAEADLYKSGFTKSGKVIGGGKVEDDNAIAKLYKTNDFKVKDDVTGESRIDAIGMDAAKTVGYALRRSGMSDDQAYTKSLVAIEEARRRSGGDPDKYRENIAQMIGSISGKQQDKGKQDDITPEKPKQQPRIEPKQEKASTKDNKQVTGNQGVSNGGQRAQEANC
jgi:hypothetical protein